MYRPKTNAKMNTRGIAFDPFNRTAVAWGNQCTSVGAAHHDRDDRHQWHGQKNVFVKCVSSFFGPLDLGSGPLEFEASVPKGHQNMNVFVGPCLLL